MCKHIKPLTIIQYNEQLKEVDCSDQMLVYYPSEVQEYFLQMVM